MTETKAMFCRFLEQAMNRDQDYEVRYGLVLYLVAVAHAMGYQSGFRIDPTEPEWPVAFIELPTGQVSWHMPQHPAEWDKHTTEDKFRRITEYLRDAKLV